MIKYVLLTVFLAIAAAAPAAEPHADPIAAPHAAPAPAIHIEAVSAEAEPHSPLAAAPVQAPAPALAPAGVPVAKQLLIAELPIAKTPASTAKLTPIAAPVLSPLAYAAPTFLAPYPAWSGLAALPATYSIEQHGYHITY